MIKFPRIFQLQKFLGVLGFSILLIGCSTPEVITKYEFITPVIYQPEHPQPLKLKEVKFQIIEYQDDVLLGLSFQHYENLSTNTASILEYIKSQKAIIKYYESMTKDSSKDSPMDSLSDSSNPWNPWIH